MDYQVKIMRLSFTGVINIIYMCIYIYTHYLFKKYSLPLWFITRGTAVWGRGKRQWVPLPLGDLFLRGHQVMSSDV